MNSWFFRTMSAMVTFGAWGFFPKPAVRYMSPQSAVVFQVIGFGFAVAAIILFAG